MATSTLVGPAPFAMGEKILAKLDQAGLPIIAAFWTYPVNGGEGSFVIASPLVDAVGTLPVYERILGALQGSPEIHLPLSAMVAVGEHDPVVRALRRGNAAREDFDATITFPNYSSYAPYLPADQPSLNVHVYRVVSTTEAGRLAESGSRRDHDTPISRRPKRARRSVTRGNQGAEE
jgi:hypothetical protein